MSSNQFFQKVVQDQNRLNKYNKVLSAVKPQNRALFNRNGSRYIINSISPVSGTSASQIIQFRILQVGRGVDKAYLQLTFNNGTASIANFNPYNAIQSMRLLSADGSNIIANIQSGIEQLRSYALLNSAQEIANYSVSSNISTTLGLGSGVPASGNRTLILPLYLMPWDSFDDNLSLQFNGDLILEVTTQDSTYFTEAGTASTLTISNPQLILDTVEYTPGLQSALKASIMNRTFQFMYLEPLLYTNTITLAASTQYTFTLSSLNGLCAALFIGVYDTSTPAGRRTPIEMENFYLTDSSGQNIVGGNTISSQYNKMEVASHFKDSVFPRYYDEIVNHFCERPDLTLGEQIPSGFYYFTGFENLVLTTPAGLAGGQYQVNVSGRFYSVLNVDNSRNLVKTVG